MVVGDLPDNINHIIVPYSKSSRLSSTIPVVHIPGDLRGVGLCGRRISGKQIARTTHSGRAHHNDKVCASCVKRITKKIDNKAKKHPALQVSHVEFVNFNHALTENYLQGKKTKGGYSSRGNSRDLRNARLFRIGDDTLILQAKCGEEYELSIARLVATVEKAKELSVTNTELPKPGQNAESYDYDDDDEDAY